jgi:hypothetical protein
VPETVERNEQSWRDRNAFPHDIESFIDRQPWRSDVLARLLDCSQEEAETLLTGRGFSYDKASNLWHSADDREVRVLRRVIEHVYIADRSRDIAEGREQLRVQFQERITEELRDEDPDDSG